MEGSICSGLFFMALVMQWLRGCFLTLMLIGKSTTNTNPLPQVAATSLLWQLGSADEVVCKFAVQQPRQHTRQTPRLDISVAENYQQVRVRPRRTQIYADSGEVHRNGCYKVK